MGSSLRSGDACLNGFTLGQDNRFGRKFPKKITYPRVAPLKPWALPLTELLMAPPELRRWSVRERQGAQAQAQGSSRQQRYL